MESKKPIDSLTVMTEIVLPNDTNTLNNLRGGRVLHWMDIAAAISAQKHSGNIVVTVAVDNVSFDHPIRLGDVVTIESKVTRVFNTSIEIHIIVWAENIPAKTKYKSNEAFYTFVALDYRGNPVQSVPITPETDEEKKLYDGALRRRELRLILSGKLKPEDAKELKSIFIKDVKDTQLGE